VALEAVRRLDVLQGADRVRWSGLIRLLFLFLERRPQAERDLLLAEVAAASPRHRPEVETMAKTIAEAWVEEGRAKGRAEAELQTARSLLRMQLEERFGPLPEAFLQQLESVTDPARLFQVALQVVRVGKLEDMQL
jgi:hypothetical protein